MWQTIASEHFSVQKRNTCNLDDIKLVKTKAEILTVLEHVKQNTKIVEADLSNSPKSIKKLSTPASKNAAQSDSLVLPSKYKVLAVMFRSMDAIVAILNNRKDLITFDKVKDGVQNIIKGNFTEKHLGQIVKVYPSAYNLSKVRCIAKKNSSSDNALVISPNLGENEKSEFLRMNPSCLINRMIKFNDNLLNIVKEHYQDFLKNINFVEASDSDIQQWHPKFSVNSVPDVVAAELPQLPESKIHTAKDLFRNINFPMKEKDKHSMRMEEQILKIMKIIQYIFIVENKATLPVEAVIEKIIHNLNSLSTSSKIKKELDLVAELFPDFLQYLQVRTRLFVKLNKDTNIYEMLEKAGIE